MKALAAVLVVMSTGAGHAGCVTPAQTLFACQIEGRDAAVTICLDPPWASYSFGPVGKRPELDLTRHVRDVGYAPWPGVGRTIFETVTFANNGFSYEVFSAIERIANIETDEIEVSVTGGIIVREGADEHADLSCVPASIVTSIDQLFDAKTQTGQCFDHAARDWKTGCE